MKKKKKKFLHPIQAKTTNKINMLLSYKHNMDKRTCSLCQADITDKNTSVSLCADCLKCADCCIGLEKI